MNAILSFIGASSLSDDEYDAIELDEQSYAIEAYDALLAILVARESVSTTNDRLRYYFLARGVSIGLPSGSSNILVGAVL